MKFKQVAKAGSFQELAKVIPDLELPHGERCRIVMQLNVPFAKAFDLAGAEHLFRPNLPAGLTLVDVWGEGWYTVVVEAESNLGPALPVICAFLVQHWLGLSLATIGILVALGFIVATVALLVTSVTAPEAIPETAKWLVLGGVATVAVVGAGYLLTRPDMSKSLTSLRKAAGR